MICKKKKENYMLDEPHDDNIYDEWVHDLFCVEEDSEKEIVGDDEQPNELTKEQEDAKKAKDAEDHED